MPKLDCLNLLTYCLAPSPLESLADVKTRVMDETMESLALLSYYLGYGWCASCRAQYNGEDFRRNGDSWEADKRGPCDGYKSDHRLKMKYGDFKFGIKDIQYGDPVRQELQPQEFYSGVLENDDPHEADIELERTVTTARTVTHTTSNSWKQSHELGIEITYNPPDATGGFGGSIGYKFGYEKDSTTTDSKMHNKHDNSKSKQARSYLATQRQIGRLPLLRHVPQFPTRLRSLPNSQLNWMGFFDGVEVMMGILLIITTSKLGADWDILFIFLY